MLYVFSAYVNYPYTTQPGFSGPQQHPVLPQPAHPTPQIYTYSHGVASTSPPHYQKPADINIQPPTVTPLTPEYPKNVQPIQYAIKKPASSFQQYYSPGLEYHYTDVAQQTKYTPQNYPVNYPTAAPIQQHYQSQSYVQPPSGAIAGIQHHYYPGFNTVTPYVPSYLSFTRQQQLKAYLQQQQQQPHPFHHYQQPQPQSSIYQHQQVQPQSSVYQQVQPQSSAYQQVQQQYQPYPSSDAYNTIKYSVPLPPYEHSKRSVAKATSTKLQPTKK